MSTENDPETPENPASSETSAPREDAAEPAAEYPGTSPDSTLEAEPSIAAGAAADARPTAVDPSADASPTAVDPSADAESPSDAEPDAESPSDAEPGTGTTSMYVRRGRTPTLGFWVTLAIAVPALAALLSAPLFEFADIGGVLNFMLVAAVFVGLPLAAIACLVDALRHRTRSTRRR